MKGKSPKLMSDWEGPYEVIHRLSNVTYRIRKGARTKSKVVHVNRLWKCHTPNFTWASQHDDHQEVTPRKEETVVQHDQNDGADDEERRQRPIPLDPPHTQEEEPVPSCPYFLRPRRDPGSHYT